MKRLKRIAAVLLVVIVALNCAGIDKTSRVQAKRGERKQSYIICTKSKKELKQLEKDFDESGQINANEEGNLEENQMIALEMTDQEAEALAENPEVTFVEKDLVVEANSTYPGNKGNSKYHKKKEKKIKKEYGKNRVECPYDPSRKSEGPQRKKERYQNRRAGFRCGLRK